MNWDRDKCYWPVFLKILSSPKTAITQTRSGSGNHPPPGIDRIGKRAVWLKKCPQRNPLYSGELSFMLLRHIHNMGSSCTVPAILSSSFILLCPLSPAPPPPNRHSVGYLFSLSILFMETCGMLLIQWQYCT